MLQGKASLRRDIYNHCHFRSHNTIPRTISIILQFYQNLPNFHKTPIAEMTIAHTGIIVPQAIHAEVVAWYLKALAPLAYKKLVDLGVTVGLGDQESAADWWITSRGEDIVTSHHAFLAPGEFILMFYAAQVGAERG